MNTSTSTQSSFWSRTYSVRNRGIRINFYFGETKLSEFNAVVDEAGRELAKLGLAVSRTFILNCGGGRDTEMMDNFRVAWPVGI